MTGRVRSVTGHQTIALTDWRLCATPPGVADGPAALDAAGVTWTAAPAPGTAAAMLRAAGAFELETSPARRFDAEDWWFRARVPAVAAGAGEAEDEGDEVVLSFEGLATVADVWLDGAPLLSSANMFRRHEAVLASKGAGELTIRCRALDPLLKPKAPRAAWRVPMIENQHLRWFRTTLLGRTPGWSPPAAAVGPWRPVVVERRARWAVDAVALDARVIDDRGRVDVALRVRALGGGEAAGEVVVSRAGVEHRAPLRRDGERLVATVDVASPALWWPHTHGEPALYATRVELSGGVVVELGALGFRTIERTAERAPAGGFGLRINGVPVFCRGACWTPPDPVALVADRATLAAAIDQACRAGMNMLRVGGTMVYESDDFYDLCDERGVLVWQDFMFANMDYPGGDAGFEAEVVAEARDFLGRVRARPALAVLCGNSEGEQQAAMWGAPRERWGQPLFDRTLAGLAGELRPDVPYLPSSAHGGAFPHDARTGATSYYGVGAYLRPLEDARRAEVSFASECLAFANVPDTLPGGPATRVHHALWKTRAPRDLGAGWDFDDVRDHYVERLFRVDAAALRTGDHERYLALGRVATGEVMAQVFGEWRRARSTCGGGLVWFLRDLWPGAGWGVVDAAGAPKAAWHFLRRALQPVAAHISDEGGNGLSIHLTNDGPAPLRGELDVSLFRAGEIRVSNARRAVDVAPHAALELPAAALFDGFLDLSYAYRFGPPSHDLVTATLRAPSGAVLAEAFHFPLGLPATREVDVGLTAELTSSDEGVVRILVKTKHFAQAVAVEVERHEADDSYFHLAPGAERTVTLRRRADAAAGPARGTLSPLNAETTAKIVLP